jgi:Arc/MetJ-type ribon-helix-helix transcriptional regulator
LRVVFDIVQFEYTITWADAVATSTTLTVRLSGVLEAHVRDRTGEDGSFENVSEYVRDLIRRDKERADEELFQRLKAELQHAFAAPDGSYRKLSAADVIRRNRR